MVREKIAIKNSASTLTGLVIILILTIGIFSIMFSYLKTQTDASGITIPIKYNDTFNRLETAQNNLDENVNAIQNNLDSIKEAESVYAVAWNGLKGLGNTLKLPVTFVSSSVDVTQAAFMSMDVIPRRIIVLATIGIIAFVVFLVLANLKGDQRL